MKKIAFTIVLNGMPFIKQQAEIIPKIFDKWYIIEGATLPVCDTGWCKNIDERFFTSDKLSIDGTTQFLDSIKSDKIEIIRKNDWWSGKTEMCNSFMSDLHDSILMQFDVDEIWTPNVLDSVLNFAEHNDGFDVMMFKCNYYVGPDLIIVNENCYGNPSDHWPRLWKIHNNTSWISHEPPRIHGLNRYLSREFTKDQGWIFNHYSYVNESQVAFKQNFYGYTDAVSQWKTLQHNDIYPCLLRKYLYWVKDDAIVDKIK